MKKPKILLIPDRPKWAYEAIARGLISALSDEYDFDIRYANNIENINEHHDKWDLIFTLGWKWIQREIRTPREKTVSTIQSHRTLNGKSINYWAEYLDDRYCAIGVVNERLHGMFDGALGSVFLTPSGVDAKKFCQDYDRIGTSKMVVGWAGRGSREFRGVDLIEEAAKESGWIVKIQNADEKKIRPELMPEFYQSLDCYINASESEGCSITVLEACACGLPLLATRTGTAPELIAEGKTGYFIDRNVDSIICALKKLNKMQCRVLGMNMRIRIIDDWTWKTKAKGYRNLIEYGLNHE